VDDLQHDGGPCATVLDCKLFVPAISCGDDFRVTGCPTVVANVDAARAQVAALEAPGCAAILSAPACHAQSFVDCAAPIAACQAGRCTSVAPP